MPSAMPRYGYGLYRLGSKAHLLTVVHGSDDETIPFASGGMAGIGSCRHLGVADGMPIARVWACRYLK